MLGLPASLSRIAHVRSKWEAGALTLETAVGSGKHIKIQIYGSPFEVLKDVVAAEKFLVEAVRAAGMRPLDEPWVYDVKEQIESQGGTPDPGEPEGVTGIVVLSTSHAAIHTWPHRGLRRDRPVLMRGLRHRSGAVRYIQDIRAKACRNVRHQLRPGHAAIARHLKGS